MEGELTVSSPLCLSILEKRPAMARIVLGGIGLGCVVEVPQVPNVGDIISFDVNDVIAETKGAGRFLAGERIRITAREEDTQFQSQKLPRFLFETLAVW